MNDLDEFKYNIDDLKTVLDYLQGSDYMNYKYKGNEYFVHNLHLSIKCLLNQQLINKTEALKMYEKLTYSQVEPTKNSIDYYDKGLKRVVNSINKGSFTPN